MMIVPPNPPLPAPSSFPFHPVASGSHTSTWISESAAADRRACTRQNARGATKGGKGPAAIFAPAAKCCALTTTPDPALRPVNDSQSAALADETMASAQDIASGPTSCCMTLRRRDFVPISRSIVSMSFYLQGNSHEGREHSGVFTLHV